MGTLNEQARPRLAYLDNVKWMVILMVVLIHASVTYSGLGSWFYKEPSTLDTVSTLVFAFYESFSQAFFMGILFFIAATFVPGSYDRKGFGRFLGDRLVRLGVPVLVFMLVLDPLIRLVMELARGERPAPSAVASQYAAVITSGHVLERTGPLWFALALLVFSILYALVRLSASGARRAGTAGASAKTLTARSVHLAAGVLIAIIAAGSFSVRTVQPIGTSWLNMQLCFFPQYIVLFLAGLWAGRRGILSAIPAAAGRAWLKLAFAVGVPVWLLLLGLGRVPHTQGLDIFFGGWHWQAAGYAAWEAFFAVSISLGLIVLFRERVNTPSPAASFLSRTSFGVYSFHAPILVGTSLMIRAWMLYPLAKAGVAAAIAFAASLVVAALVKKIPGVGRIFS